MDNLIATLVSPFQFTFMQQAFYIVILVAIPTALLSCFLVLKGWSLMGDAISHAVLPGIVLAYVFSIPFIIGAFIAGMFCALATGYLKENSRIKEDTIMGVVFSAMFALGIVLITKIHSNIHLDHIIYGDPLGASWQEIIEAGVIALLVVTLCLLKGKDLLLFIFDPQHAQAIGLPTKILHYGLLSLLSLAIVTALKAVGMILVISMLIAPGATAFMLTRQFQSMLIISLLIAIFNSVLGLYLSFFIDSAPGPTIILLLTANFIGVFIYTSIKNRNTEKLSSSPLSVE
ncbi:metal ABC transporter permease [Photobacterium leiognathi]|uniref:metal ABC transporter permease n=1 Tax=Photobacterium leiognathi TaxID=553611 RepID=UPI00298160C8|nr:metal ABC transporter permease [Photobacterium leiognathi]